MPKSIEETEALRLIWYQYGIKSNVILSKLANLQLDNLDINAVEKLQTEATKLKEELAKALEEHVAQYPD